MTGGTGEGTGVAGIGVVVGEGDGAGLGVASAVTVGTSSRRAVNDCSVHPVVSQSAAPKAIKFTRPFCVIQVTKFLPLSCDLWLRMVPISRDSTESTPDGRGLLP